MDGGTLKDYLEDVISERDALLEEKENLEAQVEKLNKELSAWVGLLHDVATRSWEKDKEHG